MRKPKALFVFAKQRSENSTRFGGYEKRLRRFGGLEYLESAHTALEDLSFYIDNNQSVITDQRINKPLSGYGFVYFKDWLSLPEQAAALAYHLQAKGVPFIDRVVIQKGSDYHKLLQAYKLTSAGLPIVPTWFAMPDKLVNASIDCPLKFPMILKDAVGQKGQNNYLVNNQKELIKITKQNPDIQFVAQNYIENDFDYRVQVYGYKASLVIKRSKKSGSHLNNTSAGGKAELIELEDFDKNLLELAESAAKAMNLQVCGVDILVDKSSKEPYVLEVNQGSQVVTGAYIDKNIPAFDRYLKSAVARRVKISAAEEELSIKPILGRHIFVNLPGLNLQNIIAKVDTGAYSCSLHAENIKELKKDGHKVLSFDVPVLENGRYLTGKTKTCFAKKYEIIEVRSSNGVQNRYRIEVSVEIFGKKYPTKLTLSNRGSLKYPMLLGRRLLRGNFLVNVELSQRDI